MRLRYQAYVIQIWTERHSVCFIFRCYGKDRLHLDIKTPIPYYNSIYGYLTDIRGGSRILETGGGGRGDLAAGARLYIYPILAVVVVVVNSLFANASLHSGTKTAYWQVPSLYIKNSIISLHSPLLKNPFKHRSLILVNSFTCIHMLINSALLSHTHFHLPCTLLSLISYILRKYL